MNAGSTTTAVAMCNVSFQLLKHTNTTSEAANKVDNVIGDAEEEDDGIIACDTVKHLPYLRTFLDEFSRLFPPTFHGLTRVTTTEGINVLGGYISGGIPIAMTASVAHRQDPMFPQADKLIAERFLGEEGKSLRPFFLSVSAESCACIDRNVSHSEHIVVLATVLWRFGIALGNLIRQPERLNTMDCIFEETPLKV
ncbi:hypothetical protein NX059_007392 [Plenodomus lindquistii]|nr:hypothetical protein NX059_007392 [Plenodomus lindquistii]